MQYIFELEEYLMSCLILSHCPRHCGALLQCQHLRDGQEGCEFVGYIVGLYHKTKSRHMVSPDAWFSCI